MYKNFNLTEEERKQILEQHSAYGYRKPLNEESPMTEQFGCIADGVNSLKKVTTDMGTAFTYTPSGGRYILYQATPNPELAKKVMSANPLVKVVGRGMNMDTKEEVAYYCASNTRDGLRVAGMNDTIQSAPTKTTGSTTMAPVNEQIPHANVANAIRQTQQIQKPVAPQGSASMIKGLFDVDCKAKVIRNSPAKLNKQANMMLIDLFCNPKYRDMSGQTAVKPTGAMAAAAAKQPISESMVQAQMAIGDAKSKMSSGEKPDSNTMEQIKQCITQKQLTSLMFLTTGAGAFALGIVAILITGGAVTGGSTSVVGMVAGGTLAVGSIITLFITGLSEKDGGLGADPSRDVKALLSCMGI